jgi:NADPH:quinone reductase-like Zn-dependent oxidoreductase
VSVSLQTNSRVFGMRESKIQFYACTSTHHIYCRKKVISTASTPDKLEWLLSLPNGPTHTVNYKTQDFAAEVKKITNGKGVDVIIDFPGQSHFNKNIDSLAVDGRMTMLALLSGVSFCHYFTPFVFR